MLTSPDALHLLGRQFWVADISQLVAAGISARTLARARHDGALVSILPGIVQLAGATATFETRAMALQLYAGPPAFLSGPTAGRLLGLRSMPREPVNVTVPERRQLRLPTWARCVRTTWIDPDIDVVERPDGFRVASPLRMLFGLAGHFSQRFLERAAEDAWHLGLVRPDDAAAYLAGIRRSGRSGVTRFERWLQTVETARRPCQSGFELDVLHAVRDAGLPEPVRQHALVLPSGERVHLDLAWPALRLGVEPGHSWWHGGDLGQRRDQARDRACTALGWQIVRFDERDRLDPGRIAQELQAIYRRRERCVAPAAPTPARSP